MSGFAFRLEKLLDIRRRQEEDEAKRLGEARRSVEAMRNAEDDLKNVLEAGRARLAEAHGTSGSVGQLRNLEFLVERISERVRAAARERARAQERLADAKAAFRTAVNDRRCLDRLRERREVEWNREADRADQRRTDEVAAQRHARGSDSSYLEDVS